MNYPEKYRIAGVKSDDGGAFKVPYQGRDFYIIASHGGGWNHVSISLENRTPSWKEMCYFKKMFFGEDALVVQFHPPAAHYKNLHLYCLHMWQPHDNHIQLPPREFV